MTLAELCAEARREHPDLVFEDDVLASLVAIPNPRAADIALARVAVRGDTIAIRIFEYAYAGLIGAVCRRFADRSHSEDDLRQILRTKLFVGDAPVLAEYNGTASLATWLRVIATRLFIDLSRRKDRARETLASEPEDLDDTLVAADLGLEAIKAEHRRVVAAAMRASVKALGSGERHLLRQHLVVGLTIDQLGAVLGLHRSTAARRVEKARNALVEGARERVQTQLALDAAELSEVFGLVVSKLDVSMRRLLATKSSP